MISDFALLSTGAGGATVTMLATAVSTDPASTVAPYVGGGAGVVAVVALGEVTRRLLNGRLIPRETKDYEEELGAAIVASGQREERLIRVVEDVREELRLLRREISG